jgi:hypothetical protein
LKLFKGKDERPEPEPPAPRTRRKSSRSDDSAVDSLDEEKSTCNRTSLKSRAAVFEQANQRASTDSNKNNKREEFVRVKDEDTSRYERRRHTFESRDRDGEEEKSRRVSLETRSPR